MCHFSFTLKLSNLLNWWKIKWNLITVFSERNIFVLLLNLRLVIHISSFCIVNLLCCGRFFITLTFVDIKTKYRSRYLWDIFWPYVYNHKRKSLGYLRKISLGHLWETRVGHVPIKVKYCTIRSFPHNLHKRLTQDVARRHPLALHIGKLGHVLSTLPWNILTFWGRR